MSNDKNSPRVALYARVSTDDQDPERQLREGREFVRAEYAHPSIEEYVDLQSGTDPSRAEYDRLRDDIRDGALDAVVVHELSRLSRLGSAEVERFVSLALEHETSIRDMEVGLDISMDDDLVDRAVSRMIANVMADLARIEHRQKIRRIRSGIEAAREAGKWVGRPPRGFTVKDGYLRVDPAEFLATRDALARVAAGEPAADVARDTDIPVSTLRHLNDERRDLYLRAQPDDDRVAGALEELQPLEELSPTGTRNTREKRVRELVREELDRRLDNS